MSTEIYSILTHITDRAPTASAHAFKSRPQANARARALLRQWGRPAEEWMDENGLFHGAYEGKDNDGEDERVEVWVVKLTVVDEDGHGEEEE